MTDLDRKRRDLLTAKSQLEGTIAALKAHVTPEAITDSVGDSARDYVRRTSRQAARTFRAKPIQVVAAGIAAALFLFRKPITRAIKARRTQGDDRG